MARKKYESESPATPDAQPVDGIATMDADPQTFVAETPVAVDAKPVALQPDQVLPVPVELPEKYRLKLEARRIKAEAKAKRDAYSGQLTAVLFKSRNVNGTIIKTNLNAPTPVAEITLSGITLAQFEALLISRALRFEPKG